jgi:hypothetical protein
VSNSAVAEIPFAPAVIRGLAALGPIEVRRPDLSLDLGLSIWMRRSRTHLDDVQGAMMAIRRAILQAAEMDIRTEPIPLFGHGPKVDVKNFASYLGELLIRAAAQAGCDVATMVERSIVRLAA